MVVADGVRGFVDKYDVSARDFARALTVKTMGAAMATPPPQDAHTNRAKKLVEEGWAKTAADRHGPPGASTIAVAATTHDEDGRLCVDFADNGDTAVDRNMPKWLPTSYIRQTCDLLPAQPHTSTAAAGGYARLWIPSANRSRFPHHGPPIIVAALEPMQHRNQPNCPFQLQRIPRRRAADILIPPPALLKRLTRTDHQAEDASEATIGVQACRCPVESGDIIIACSDGVTDNLFHHEIVFFFQTFRSLPADKLAAHLARLAYRKSKNKREKLDTPFRQMWEANGEECRQGAKEDDITVLVAKVEAGEGNCEEGEAGRRAGWLVEEDVDAREEVVEEDSDDDDDFWADDDDEGEEEEPPQSQQQQPQHVDTDLPCVTPTHNTSCSRT
ncbi:unnamed protein product [Vitrella brassicaformis CCMP3155]|uniref:Protein phosphatase n=1 Tax=Vitrella brassicaformis (strain CCMP3155) TaxID=1169540 RepID=A0A0G4FNI7_VITBC|nr:unnamed protein product [Vitrella brassicaformis CCMP3155]|eukprot:CEM15787.1 unnamed protein product [Vitrella brassicaformis CCMP3155]